ncbi:Uncharacterised protein [Streptococcus pneumoniae]|nr:Uncharacterised protein [Streptococcus pneumoniae]
MLSIHRLTISYIDPLTSAENPISWVMFFSGFRRLHYVSVVIKHEHTPFLVPELASHIWSLTLAQDPAIRFFLHD